MTVISVGTAMWFVAFVALLPFAGRLADDGHGSWIWTCFAGWTLGLLGIVVARAQRRAAERRRRPLVPDRGP